MRSLGMQMLGSSLALLGWLLVVLACGLPMWKVTAFIGINIVTAQIIWEGIWMSCVMQSTGQTECKMYDSTLVLSSDLQAARALMVIAIITGIAGLLVAFIGGKCTNFIAEGRTKAKITSSAGILLITTGILCLVPVSWTGSSIISDFYNPLLTDAQRREIGASIYIGWGATILLILGGALLLNLFPPKEESNPSVKYLIVRSSTARSQGNSNQVFTVVPTAMALQTLGITMSMIGLAGTILICALPMWRVTAFVGTNIVVAQVFWEGLWMNCVYETTGQMQCKIYDALLDLSPDLQAARGLVVIAMVLACLGFLIFLVGAQCTKCLANPRAKARVVLASGVSFLLSGLTTIVPISWTANTIIQDFHNPVVPEPLKKELGAALYVGWVTAGFLLFGGAVLCTTCPPEKITYSTRYTLAGTQSSVQRSYAIKNYV